MTFGSPNLPEHEDSESSVRRFRQYNPDWGNNIFSDTEDSWQHGTSRWHYEGPRAWHQIFRDFLRMGSEEDCDYLLNEPTADFSHAYRWYAVVNIAILVIFVLLMLILLPQLPDDAFETNTRNSPGFNNPNTARQVQITAFAPENLVSFYCVYGSIGILINIIVLSMMLFVVHTVATSAFQGNGDYEKLVYGIFTLNSAYSLAYSIAALVLIPLFIVLFLLMEALFMVAYCFLFITLLFVTLYILYLYTLVVKTAYKIGWGSAFVSGIVAPFAAVMVLYCGCIFCFGTTASG